LTNLEWTVVVPVKGTVAAKSRLGASRELAIAIALDTVAGAISAAGNVIVVTSRAVASEFEALGARVVMDPGGGLGGAVAAGIAAALDSALDSAVPAAEAVAIAVLLGDVPALQPRELRAALMAAESHPLSFVADADGTGTVLIAALDGRGHTPAFGPDSRARHVAAGYVELPVDAASGLRRDVDTPEQLDALAGRLGARTVAALAGRP
jgi:2-phospho-L-lactate guanylyltransferase